LTPDMKNQREKHKIKKFIGHGKGSLPSGMYGGGNAKVIQPGKKKGTKGSISQKEFMYTHSRKI